MRHCLISTALLLVLVSCACIGCKGDQADQQGEDGGVKPIIYTTFYPTTYFAQRIGGDAVDVVCPCPPDEDAIFWMPDSETILKYQQADLIIVNGAEFEKWVQKASLPESKIVDTAEPFEKEFITFEEAITHKHGPAGEHTHEGIDGHTWVDPVSAKIQAGQILEAMVRSFPKHKDAFEKNYRSLIRDLNGLDSACKALAAKYKGQPILCSHPAYNYISRRYGWNICNLDLDPEQMPSKEQIDRIREILKSHEAKFLVWEAYPTDEIDKKLKDELGLTSVEFSPAELIGPEEIKAGLDYLKIMQQNLKNMEPVLTGP